MGRDGVSRHVPRIDDRFNPRARMGRDITLHIRTGHFTSFNPRARMGRDSCGCLSSIRRRCFNPRARMGRDRTASSSSRRTESFNPRARMGRDNVSALAMERQIKFQSTRPHGARPDVQKLAYGVAGWVSIHAPAWGATWCPRGWLLRLVSFQSTRPHGARRARIRSAM